MPVKGERRGRKMNWEDVQHRENPAGTEVTEKHRVIETPEQAETPNQLPLCDQRSTKERSGDMGLFF